MGLLLCLLLFLCVSDGLASVTVYNQQPLGDQTTSASSATYTGAAAYDPTVLTPPPVPSGFVTQLSLNVQASSSNVQGLSAPLKGSFLGFSIEFSVINQVLGINSSFIEVPFLNLMENIRERGGEVRIRVGGNTQETATLVDSLPGGVMMMKDTADTSNPTQTPALLYTPEVLYLLGNISALVDVKWFLGIPFNDTTHLRLGVAEVGEDVLSSSGHLLGFQVGNEPDLYAAHGNRPANYSPYDYFGEFGVVVAAVNADSSIPVKNNLIAPSVSGTWTPEDVFNTGLVPSYDSSLGFLAVEHYPTDNCYAEYGIGSPVDPQQVFPSYLSHNGTYGALALVAPYLNASAYSASVGKPFIMMETNTASCGGFPGISDSFGAAMWGVDYALQMGAVGFWGGMMHVGGQDVYYNPFTPPPTNQSSYHQWTVGAIYYSSLFVAEALGPTGTAQLVDLTNALTSSNAPVSTSAYTPVYGVYEAGQMSRLVVFNYVSDSSGASDVTFTFGVEGGQMPGSVVVKYLQAPSVSEKANITWAGQTFGNTFSSDGRLQGSLTSPSYTCNPTSNTCTIPLPAPCIALIFLSPSSLSESSPSSTHTFATTAYTKTVNTATINPTVLATSNGMSGVQREVVASTSDEGAAVGLGEWMRRGGVGAVMGLAVVLGVGMVWW